MRRGGWPWCHQFHHHGQYQHHYHHNHPQRHESNSHHHCHDRRIIIINSYNVYVSHMCGSYSSWCHRWRCHRSVRRTPSGVADLWHPYKQWHKLVTPIYIYIHGPHHYHGHARAGVSVTVLRYLLVPSII